jgi:hypothetical protein
MRNSELGGRQAQEYERLGLGLEKINIPKNARFALKILPGRVDKGRETRRITMPQNQAVGLMLVGIGVLLYFLIAQIWTRTKLDPHWMFRGDFRQMVGVDCAQVLNSVTVVAGALLGTGAVSFGLKYLYSV